MKSALLSSFLLPALVVMAPAPTDAGKVFRTLDTFVADGDEAAARAVFESMNLTPAKLAEVIRGGRPVESGKTGVPKLELTDGFGRTTDLYLLVPDGYDPTKPAGVMVLLHGLGGDGRQLRDRLYSQFAGADNYILACPTAQKEPADALSEDDPGPLGQAMKHWWSYRPEGFALSAVREVRRKYAVDDDRVIVSGYSMGGFGTWNLGLRYPDRFSAMVPFAGGVSRTEYLNPKGDPKLRPLVENARHIPLYFVHGDRDTTVPVRLDRLSRDQLVDWKIDHEYVEVKGGKHVLDVREGGELMTPIQTWLKGKRRDRHPKRITYVSLGAYAPGAWWAHLDGTIDRGARFEAEVRDGNVIEVSATGAKRMKLYLDEELLDFSKPVVVRCGEKELWRGAVAESFEAVLESWRRCEDRGLVYRARVVVDLP